MNNSNNNPYENNLNFEETDLFDDNSYKYFLDQKISSVTLKASNHALDCYNSIHFHY
ncbi:hypothetical protein [Fluviispira sanaruensis]|uniref:Uncharacterized protein n=1 Tax=Fluviispira sanaruensis TaxID=2493639 RepID=A0A4P2VM20_FLUSA|nr:hypothetical protein [Fluviispira sanaruensis]BBH53971.1 hypothetical protein JCM31447_24240 [Fluviispira sanaruensis]